VMAFPALESSTNRPLHRPASECFISSSGGATVQAKSATSQARARAVAKPMVFSGEFQVRQFISCRWRPLFRFREPLTAEAGCPRSDTQGTFDTGTSLVACRGYGARPRLSQFLLSCRIPLKHRMCRLGVLALDSQMHLATPTHSTETARFSLSQRHPLASCLVSTAPTLSLLLRPGRDTDWL
jgi:hypothetical protein